MVDGVFGFVGGIIDFHVGNVLEVVDVADFEAADVEAGAGFQVGHQLVLAVGVRHA